MRRPKRLYFKKVNRQPQITIELDLRPVIYMVDAITGAAKAIGRALQPLNNTLRGIRSNGISPELREFIETGHIQAEFTYDLSEARFW